MMQRRTLAWAGVLAAIGACSSSPPLAPDRGPDAAIPPDFLQVDGLSRDGPPLCDPARRCGAEWAAECTAGKIRTCQFDASGCLMWTEPVACPQPSCAGPAECAGCTHACAPAGSTECSAGALRTCQLAAGCLVWSMPSPCPTTTCAGPTACVDTSSTAPIWVLHLSDLHFGDSAMSQAFASVTGEVMPAVKPVITVATGDITDDGGVFSNWTGYDAATGKVPAYPHYMEISGNHDVKNGGAPNYLLHTVTGKAGGGFYGQAFVDSAVGRIRVMRTNTADTDVNPINVAGFFGDKQMNNLLALSPGTVPIKHAIVLGHHPMTGILRLQAGSDARMQKVIDQVGAKLYLCGHVHLPAVSWLKKTLVVQAASLGVSSPPSFALVALDPSGPTAKIVPMSPTVKWPLVMVTSPADAALGGTNPYAVTHSSPIDVRALAFAPSAVTAVEARLGEGQWQAMSDAGGYFAATLPLAGATGTLKLEVRATSGGVTASHVVSVNVGP